MTDEFKPQPNYTPVSAPESNLLPSSNGTIMGGNEMKSPNYVPSSAGWRIKGDGDADFQNVTVNNLQAGGVIEITVETTDDLQTALDKINTQGGGVLRLSPGTYTVATDLNVYDSTTIQGDSNANTFLDFNSNSKSIKWTGTDIYTTGTVASTSGTTVNGSGTTWTSAMVGRHILMDERWYRIVAFVNATTIVIESAYQDGASFSGTYRIANVINNVAIKDVTIKNSGSTGLVGIDILDVELEDVLFLDNNKGFDFDNFSRVTVNRVVVVSNTSNGFELTQGTFFNATSGIAAIANGGSGAVLNNIKSCTFVWSAANSNTADGYNCTDVTNCQFKLECSSNGGQGIEFVSGCNNNFINDSLISNNTSDGIKLTATSDNNTMGASLNLISNGGYGINIAASTCDNNTILAPLFLNNTSGTYTDSGTGTIVIERVTPSEYNTWFGNGADGDATISGNTTLTSDKYYNNLTVNSSVTLTTAGYRIFVKDTLINNGTIEANGGDGSVGASGSGGGTGGTGGAAPASGYLAGGTAGVTGGDGGDGGDVNGHAGAGGTSISNTLGSNGTAGGDSGIGGSGGGGYDSTPNAGGAGGTATAAGTKPYDGVSGVLMLDFSTPATPVTYKSSAGSGSGGGGGGAANGSSTGGGGGGSGATGGIVFIAGKTITNSATGIISADGGDGGNGGNGEDGPVAGAGGAGGGGGGAGGSGGVVFLSYSSLTNNGSITVAAGSAGSGGSGGTGNTTGNDGTAGSAGTVGNAGVTIQLQA